MKYCGNCGRKLEENEICDCINKIECPVCHYPNKKDAISCPRCGNDFNKPEAEQKEFKKVALLILGFILLLVTVFVVFSKIEYAMKDIFENKEQNTNKVDNIEQEENIKEQIKITDDKVRGLYSFYIDGKNELSPVILFEQNKKVSDLTDKEKLNFVLKSLTEEEMKTEVINGLEMESLENISWTNIKINKEVLIKKIKEIFGSKTTFTDLDNLKEYIYIEQGEENVINKLFLFESNGDVIEGNEVVNQTEINTQKTKDVKMYSMLKEAYKKDGKLYIVVNYLYYEEIEREDLPDMNVAKLYFDSKKEREKIEVKTNGNLEFLISIHTDAGNEPTFVFRQENNKYYFEEAIN